MSHRARHQLLALPGIIFLVLFPIILSLWIAFLWAKSEVNNQLRTFAQLALDKSELVIRQADLVSDAAERYQGQVCTPAHQKRMLNIIRGYLYINELIYARDNHFLCSSLIAPVNGYTIAPADYKREPNVSIYYYRDTPFFSGYKMTYMQRGNYVAVINPLFWSEVMSDDPTLQWGDENLFLVKQRGLGSNVFSADSFEGFNRTKKWLFICDSLFDKTPNCSHCCDFISTSYNPFL